MTPNRFKQIVEEMIAHCQKTLLEKNDEYSRNGDRLWNFKIAGRKLGAPPEMRRVMIPLEQEFKTKYPEAFDGTM